MKYGVIDVGSNSVRLMIDDNGVGGLNKRVKTTRLSEGLGIEKIIKREPLVRTVNAIKEFVDIAKRENVDKLFVFATAAVRQANNRQEFIDAVKNNCDIEVEIISGEQEAKFGALGVLNGADGIVVDVGGASTEIIVVKNSNIVYSNSFEIGAVKLKDACGQDYSKNQELLNKIFNLEIDNRGLNVYAIGGTATSISAILMGLDVYDPYKIDGSIVEYKVLKELCRRLFITSIENRKQIKGLQKERAEIISNGALILQNAMEVLGVKRLIISEKDNLEGYLSYKTQNNA